MSVKTLLSARVLAPAMCLVLLSGSAMAGDGAAHGKSGMNGNGGIHGNAGIHGNSDNGNRGNGNGNGNGNGRDPLASAFSKLASELKWMNSAHANQRARDNAAAHSRVGRDGTYLIAALDTLDAFTALEIADAELAETADNMTLEEANALLEGTSDPVEQETYQLLVDYKVAQETEAEALDTASDGLTLSDTALNAYRSLLGV